MIVNVKNLNFAYFHNKENIIMKEQEGIKVVNSKLLGPQGGYSSGRAINIQ